MYSYFKSVCLIFSLFLSVQVPVTFIVYLPIVIYKLYYFSRKIENNNLKIKKSRKWCCDNSSVIRQKGESHIECFKKTKHVKFSEKRTFLTPWYAHAPVGIRGYDIFVFREIWRALFFWNTCFEIRPLPNYRRIKHWVYFSLYLLEMFQFVVKHCIPIYFSGNDRGWLDVSFYLE